MSGVGSNGGGDSANFVQWMYDWFLENAGEGLVYEFYFGNCDPGNFGSTCTDLSGPAASTGTRTLPPTTSNSTGGHRPDRTSQRGSASGRRPSEVGGFPILEASHLGRFVLFAGSASDPPRHSLDDLWEACRVAASVPLSRQADADCVPAYAGDQPV